jgi:iron complex transport system permease protein
MRSRLVLAWILLLAVSVTAVACRLLVWQGLDGSLELGWSEAAASWRVQATATAALAGAALGVSGTLLQGMLRNPLASPFILGLSGGAQAAMAMMVLLAWRAGVSVGAGSQLLGGTLGSLAALMLTMALARSRARGLDPTQLVLAGVVVAAIAGSVASLCEWLLPPGERAGVLAWSLGRVPEAPEPLLLAALAASLGLVVGCGITWSRWLDALQLGDDEARSVGVSLGMTRAATVAGSSLLAAAATAICGPLAFVGLVGPHAARALLGVSHQRSLPGSAVAGAVLLVAADAARMLVPVQGGRLPVGLVCALAGGPVFLLLLRRGAGRAWS